MVAVDGDDVAVLPPDTADALLGVVFVILLGVDAPVLDDPVEGVVHQATCSTRTCRDAARRAPRQICSGASPRK